MKSLKTLCPVLLSEGEDYAMYSKSKQEAIKLSDDILYIVHLTDRLCIDITMEASHLEANEKNLIDLSGVKGKAIPLQAWTGPEGSRRLRLPDFKTIGT